MFYYQSVCGLSKSCFDANGRFYIEEICELKRNRKLTTWLMVDKKSCRVGMGTVENTELLSELSSKEWILVFFNVWRMLLSFFPCSALWCLDDVPFRNELPYLKKLPGQIYTIDQQCQHDFGRNSRFCSRVGVQSCFCFCFCFFNIYLLVPSPRYPERPVRFRSRGLSEFSRPFVSDTSANCINREGLGRRQHNRLSEKCHSENF